ncbi:MAG: polysaccharide deacetylase family protein [Lachnospiraceae bacterium]|nr:polysaccharide deacetylase family protein [Lachnospiraceae bacterium]
MKISAKLPKRKFSGTKLIVPALCALIAAAGAFVVGGQLSPVFSEVQSRKLPIYCVSTEKAQVALSFDAAWGNEDTSTLLSILDEYGVKATFFMTGGWVESYPDDVKAIAAAGHDLGNHSENHKQMSTLSAGECKEEIQSVHDKVKELTGLDMTLFRPPYGDYNDTLIEAANGLGYHVIQWNVDSLDWKDYGADAIVSRVLDNEHLGNGTIILMHNGATYTKDALPRVIEGLKEKGYELVPISELIYTENYEMDHEGRQYVTGS